MEDNGIGISEEDRSRIFQRFYQAGDTHRTGGMGLGLSMVRQIVQLHGGTITVDSAVDKGTTFTVFLPEHPRKEENK